MGIWVAIESSIGIYTYRLLLCKQYLEIYIKKWEKVILG